MSDSQLLAAATNEKTEPVELRIASALERCATALEKLAGCVDDDPKRPSFHIESDGEVDIRGAVDTYPGETYE